MRLAESTNEEAALKDGLKCIHPWGLVDQLPCACSKAIPDFVSGRAHVDPRRHYAAQGLQGYIEPGLSLEERRARRMRSFVFLAV